jgi:hypothetical protein
MRILFIPTVNLDKQGDLLEVSLLHGLRSVLGENLIDYPRKKIMYHDFSETKKETLHGRGNTLLTYPILDLSENQRKLQNIDAIIYGDGHMYGEGKMKELHSLTKNIWVIDGHDLHGNAPRKIKIKEGDDEIEVIGVQFKKCFKRELVEDGLDLVFPTGFGIPTHRIRPICFSKKDQLFQKTAPDNSTFGEVKDLGGGFIHHKFTNEEDYYDDLSRSWFGLTCKKGGWDCLRHYEIIAAGTVLLFRDYNKKHPLCSPQNLPCLSYSTKDELEKIMNRLVINDKPTDEYLYYLNEQRKWLYNVGTTEARALEIIKTIRNYEIPKI